MSNSWDQDIDLYKAMMTIPNHNPPGLPDNTHRGGGTQEEDLFRQRLTITALLTEAVHKHGSQGHRGAACPGSAWCFIG